ncbi:hypothetical protein KC19_2G250900 [Ceratodon purpureus]|uniref:Uncharacterized protein n=1 Tax=Ceratodon purpureus TaxID=3225 RepID=A0A8T0IZ80_CERPU|nr:hypothetical protein KC19_2G250900 [Ceratodon purpureus]
MEYYRPGDRPAGYAVGPELVEDGAAFGEMGAIDRGFRPGGGYVDDGYERRRPLGGEYVGGGAPEYYGGERPGGYGYGREGYGRDGYAPSGYGQGYPQQQVIIPPPVEYVEPEPSDLGMGLRDSNLVSRHHSTDYGAGYGGPDVAGYGGAPGYGRSEYNDDEERRLRKELEHEKHRKHEFELATAAALGYGLHERHEKSDAEEELEKYERGKEKKHHHFYRGEGGLE